MKAFAVSGNDRRSNNRDDLTTARAFAASSRMPDVCYAGYSET